MKKILHIGAVTILVMAQSAHADNPQERLSQSNAEYFNAQGQSGVSMQSAINNTDYDVFPDQRARLMEMNHRYFSENEPQARPVSHYDPVLKTDSQQYMVSSPAICSQPKSTICK